MRFKQDWEEVQERFEAWWAGEDIGRPLIQITAPRDGCDIEHSWTGWNLAHNLDHPEQAVKEFEKCCQGTYFGAEAFPNLWINFGPGIMAAFFGAEPRITERTVWFETPKEWDQIDREVKFDPDNRWWSLTRKTTDRAVGMGAGKFFVGMTDLGGSLDIIASLRGAQTLLFDLLQCPDQVRKLSKKITQLSFRYYDELHQIIQTGMKGASAWMGLWAPRRWYPLQCDFSAMISPEMFEEFVMPDLRAQCQWFENTIYHCDGPGQIPHLDLLLDILELDGIQWVPGAGNPQTGSPRWFPLYRRIQEKGKLLVLQGMAKDNVERVVKELSTRGLLITTNCSTEGEARELIENIEKWARM